MGQRIASRRTESDFYQLPQRLPPPLLLLRTRPRLENFFGLERVFFAHQHLESSTRPGDVRSHSTGGVGLNHCVDLCCFEGAQGDICLELI